MDAGLSMPLMLPLLRPASDSGRSEPEPAKLLEEPISDRRLPESRTGVMSSSSDSVLQGATTAGRRSWMRDRLSLAMAEVLAVQAEEVAVVMAVAEFPVRSSSSPSSPSSWVE